MTGQLIAIGVLVVMGLVWLVVNIKAASGALKAGSFFAMCAFLLAASVVTVRLVLGVLA